MQNSCSELKPSRDRQAKVFRTENLGAHAPEGFEARMAENQMQVARQHLCHLIQNVGGSPCHFELANKTAIQFLF